MNFNVAREEKRMFTTLPNKTYEDKVALYNAMQNPDETIKSMINKEFDIVDVTCQFVDFEDEDTGEIRSTPQIIITSSSGITYKATSNGVYNALQQIFNIFGHPSTWESPITVTPLEVPCKGGSYTTLKVV